MGTWGINNFENDTAGDWVYSFEENPSILFLKETIEKVLGLEYVDSDEACEALAAIETIAAIRNKPAADFPEMNGIDLRALAVAITPELTSLARKAIERITSEEHSELYELWAETDDIDSWIMVQKTLLNRLDAGGLRAV